jgi:hypothetical protein
VAYQHGLDHWTFFGSCTRRAGLCTLDSRAGDIVEIHLAAWREEKAYLPQLHTDDESGTDLLIVIGRRDSGALVSWPDYWLHSARAG